jgi:hypothetical protein
MLRWILLIWMLLVAPLGYAGLQYVQNKVLTEMIAASRKDDVAALAARVDWESLRAFVAEDLAAQKKFVGAQGATIGPAEAEITKVVDYYLKPENIDILYYQHQKRLPQSREEDFIGGQGYAPPFGFQVTLVYPKKAVTADPILSAIKDRIKVKFVFGLDGLTWKVKEMHVPLYLAPSQTYEVPAVKIFGRPQSP